jgi:superfamily II DNA or RNA helicase
VEQLDRVVPIEFTMFLIDGDPAEASAYDIAVTERMVECTGFHRLITRLCGTFPDEDGTLILVDKELLGKNIESAMAAAGIESSFIYGKTSKKRRDVELTRFEAREFNVLIGGKILDRGLDLKGGCENLIITTGGMMQSGFIQKLGRAVRKNRRGVGRVYDFFHRTNRTLYKHSRARLKMVVELGYKTTVIYPGGRIDGAEFVRRRFQLPKRKPTPLLK